MNYFQTLAKAIGDYLAALALFFTNIKNSVTDGVNASNGLKEGGSVTKIGSDVQITKKADLTIRAGSHVNGPDTIGPFDLRGFESFIISVTGNTGKTFRVEVSSDLITWDILRVDFLKGYDKDYPLCPEVFNPIIIGECRYGQNTTLPFMRIVRASNGGSAAFMTQFVINFSSRILDRTVKPYSFYPLSSRLFNPSTAVTSAASIDAFPVTNASSSFSPSSRYVIKSIDFTNTGTAASEVQLKDGAGVVRFTCMVNAGTTFRKELDPFIEFPGGTNSKVQIVVVSANATIFPIIQALMVQA